MKAFNKKIIILGLALSANAWSDAGTVSEINCSENACYPDNSINLFYNSSTPETSMNWINSFINETLKIMTPQGSTPRNAFIYASNTNPTKKVDIQLSSTLGNSDGGNLFLVTDIIGEIKVNSSGNFGKDGKNSSTICAERFVLGEYGAEALNYWNSRPEELPKGKCVDQDVTFLNNSFSCPVGYLEKSDPNVLVSVLESKRKCTALYSQARCLKRKVQITCNTNIIRRKCGSDNLDLKDHDTIYYPKTDRVTNDPTKCYDLAKGYKASGDILSVDYIVDEFEIIGLSDNKARCSYLNSRSSRFKVEFSDTVFVDGIPSIQKSTTRTATLDVTTGLFNIPLPDDPLDSRGDVLSPYDMSIMVESWGNIGFYDISQEGAYLQGRSMQGFTDCIGLNNSSTNDFECKRLLGPSFTFTYYIIDKYGMRSNPLKAVVPESRHRPLYIYVIGNDWGNNKFHVSLGVECPNFWGLWTLSYCKVPNGMMLYNGTYNHYKREYFPDGFYVDQFLIKASPGNHNWVGYGYLWKTSGGSGWAVSGAHAHEAWHFKTSKQYY